MQNTWNEFVERMDRATPDHAMPRRATPSYSQGVFPRLNVTVGAIPRTYTRLSNQTNDRDIIYIYINIYKCLFREMCMKYIDSQT